MRARSVAVQPRGLASPSNMARSVHLSAEEGAGVAVAIAAHAALAVALAWHATREIDPIIPPERIDVSLATEVSLESTAPDPSAEPAASYAPVLTDVPQAPNEPITAPPVQPTAAPSTTPRVPPTTRPSARSTSRPTPAPSPSSRATTRPTPTPTATRRAGGSRLGENFLEGTSSSEGSGGTPAANFGPREAAALNSAVQRQLRPHWTAPQGSDAERLVTIVRFRLNRNGSLSGEPSCIRQTGQTASNARQVPIHCERAIRAVRLASPFNLPEQFYDQWRTITSQFDRRL